MYPFSFIGFAEADYAQGITTPAPGKHAQAIVDWSKSDEPGFGIGGACILGGESCTPIDRCNIRKIKAALGQRLISFFVIPFPPHNFIYTL